MICAICNNFIKWLTEQYWIPRNPRICAGCDRTLQKKTIRFTQTTWATKKGFAPKSPGAVIHPQTLKRL